MARVSQFAVVAVDHWSSLFYAGIGPIFITCKNRALGRVALVFRYLFLFLGKISLCGSKMWNLKRSRQLLSCSGFGGRFMRLLVEQWLSDW